MIVVANFKAGVGCSTIAYNLGKILGVNIHFPKDSFIFQDKYINLFSECKKIGARQATSSPKVVDLGTNLTSQTGIKFLKNAKSVVVPMDFGYGTLLKTAETIDYIKSIAKNAKIVLVMNRLDRNDANNEFKYKKDIIMDVFKSASNNRYDLSSMDDEYLLLTYLRTSNLLSSAFQDGYYFLEHIVKDINQINDEAEDEIEYNDPMDSFKKAVDKKIEIKLIGDERRTYSLRILLFLYCAYRALFYDRETQTYLDYFTNTDYYFQNKDMVMFRNYFVKRFNYFQGSPDSRIVELFEKYIDGTKLWQNSKLFKDFVFITIAASDIDEIIFEVPEVNEADNALGSPRDILYSTGIH